ncbi:MAG TPA: GntG family PLP-dependent aldolase [Bryobacteraceae bacterium]|nr:GntG family PLP-dependent aldolase [Bryobacteraceae bacterium]
MIDLRSDTVTRPSAAMRRAMFEAEVGDDVYAEDPTVNKLERRAAEIFGREAAVFVPTGTMGNTIGVKLHTHHGEEVICEARAHILDYELSMTAWFSGCLIRSVYAEDGILRWPQIRTAFRAFARNSAPTALVEIENTHNIAGGRVTPVEDVNEICREAHALGLKVHMDGARIFNAAAYLGVSVIEAAGDADTVMFCLSKGLGAPAGSMLVGCASDIARARLYRKRLGGGMRQAGILAAAGLIALEEMPARLPEDHANAKFLARELARIPGIALDPAAVQTNIVIFDVGATGIAGPEFSARLKAQGVLLNSINAITMRALTHCDVNRADCERALEVIRNVAEASR